MYEIGLVSELKQNIKLSHSCEFRTEIRENSTQEGLERIATYNMTMLQSEDLMKSAMAAMNRDSDEAPEFANFQ